jgi:hypothetical protein
MGPVLIGIGSMVRLIAGIPAAVTALSGAWTLLSGAFAAVRVAALATLPALLPYLVPLGAIALAVGAVYLAWKNWDKIKAIAAGVGQWISDHAALVIAVLGPVGSAIVAVVSAFTRWDRIKAIVASVYTAIKAAFVDKLEAVWTYIKSKVGGVVELFRWMWDKLVGHSYVPDTVDAIEQHFGRLGDVMVAPAEKATKAVNASFAKLKSDLASLLDELFPDEAQIQSMLDKLALLDKAAAKGLISGDRLSAARLAARGIDLNSEDAVSVTDQGPLTANLPDIGAIADRMPELVSRTNQWKDALSQIGNDLFSRIGDDLSGIIDGTMKLKDLWKDLLAFGIRELTSSSGPLGSLFGGARASGGPVLSGSAYLVGEKGPEIFMPSSAGRIVSNDNSRRMMGGSRAGGDVYMTVVTPDANSFRRSEGQVTRSLKRRLR